MPMQNKPIQLAVVDMAGTTVADDGLVVSAFEMAATAVGVPESGPERDSARQYVLDTMGQSKISVFRALFGAERGPLPPGSQQWETRAARPKGGCARAYPGRGGRPRVRPATTSSAPPAPPTPPKPPPVSQILFATTKKKTP